MQERSRQGDPYHSHSSQGQGTGGHGESQQQGILRENENEIEFICKEGEPLQFIRYDKKTGKFTVEPRAVEVSGSDAAAAGC